jgi:hypothetical protein
MLTTIELDDETCVWTAEIGDVSIDRHLPLELPSIQTSIAQTEP